MKVLSLLFAILLSSCIGGTRLAENIEGSWTPDMPHYQKEIDQGTWVLYPYTLQPIQPNDSLIFQSNTVYNFKMGKPDSSNVTSPSYNWIIEHVDSKGFVQKKWRVFRFGFILEDPKTGRIKRHYVLKCNKGKMVIRFKNGQRLYLKKSESN